MLNKKMIRDIRQNKSQFLTIFLMVLIGVMVYVGIEAYMSGMITTARKFYSSNNLQDLNVVGYNLSVDDLNKIKSLKNVKDAERKLVVTGIDAKNTDKTFLISFIESNNISQFYVKDGVGFDSSKKGVWVDNFYAEKNNLHVGDTLKIKYDTIVLEEKILGLINVPDHLYDTKDESELVPDREKFGFIYMSANEIPKEYIESLVIKQLGLQNVEELYSIIPDFDYKKYIPYNYIMVDVNSKNNVESVKYDIEDNVKNAAAIIKIEDTSSYQMYQGEIDEGKSYVGIFSGLFIFIAVLSVITTMTRVIKKQKNQIGTLKALGLKNKKIAFHYVKYGLFVSLFGALFGILLGRFFIGEVFLNLEMSFFEIPNGKPVVEYNSYLVALIVILIVSLITYLTCRKELKKNPAEALRTELPRVKKGSLNITTKGLFKYMNFSSKWNLRDIIRNKFRTITGIVGIVGCCMLIVCAFGMLNSMNHFIKLQFEELYNFDYKLTLNDNISQSEIKELENIYGTSTSETLAVEYKNKENNRITNTIFVDNTNGMVKFKDNKNNYINIDTNEGVYITYKLAELENFKIGDTISWHIYGDSTYHESKIIGFNKDPQNQNITMTKEYLEKLNIEYKPDSLYTNYDLKNVKSINNVDVVQDISGLKESMESMLSMMKQMIILIIIFAILLGAVIIYNMGILSYSEKQYQFATLKVLGFSDKKIKNIFIEQNLWITIVSIILGLPSGYYLTSWLFKACLDDNFDFNIYINISTYIIAIIGTFTVSYIVSKILSKKIKKIDMVSSLKGNE